MEGEVQMKLQAIIVTLMFTGLFPLKVHAADAQFVARLAAADAGKGETVARKCKVCHTFEKGGKNKIGPNLYGIIGRNIGSVEGFKYSRAVQEKEGNWSFELLDCFITKPKNCIKGTRMPFPGLKDAGQRAELLAFLRTLSDKPAPLPTQ